MEYLSQARDDLADEPLSPAPIRLADSEPPPEPEPAAPPGRLLALDALRGLSVLLMLLVNNVALDSATPTQLTHAPWGGGLRLADLVLPWFLFCVGVSVPFAAGAFRRKGLPSWRYDLRVLWRSAVLVLLGCVIAGSQAKQPVFALGVLQLIGLSYLIGAVLYDLAVSRRLLVTAFLLGGYWALLRFVPIPGLGPGAFEEKRNFIQHLNDTYLGPLKGLPSVIPAAALVLIGTALGDLLRLERRSPLGKTVGLLLAGFGLAGLGLLWSLDLAFSKALWTPSYVLFSAGTAAAALGLLYLLIDGTGWRWWGYPLYVFGANAITAYVAPILFKVLILQEWHVNAAGGQESLLQWLLDRCVALASGRVPGGWLYSAAYILVWWLLLWQLYRKRLFLRV